jgi:hypothetical protein
MMQGPKSKKYHVYPVLWSISADYEEMVNLMGVVRNFCSNCLCLPDELGDSRSGLNTAAPRTTKYMKEIYDHMLTLTSSDARSKARAAVGLYMVEVREHAIKRRSQLRSLNPSTELCLGMAFNGNLSSQDARYPT